MLVYSLAAVNQLVLKIQIVYLALYYVSFSATVGTIKEISIEDCSSDEEFLSCGWCEPSCSEPHPLCSAQTCTRGCLCRPPLLRHYTGQCVEQKDCLPRKCTDPNEEFVCRYGCEARCDSRRCVRPRRCLLGCHCKLGLLRDVIGHCVAPDKCYLNGLTRYELHNTSLNTGIIQNKTKLT